MLSKTSSAKHSAKPPQLQAGEQASAIGAGELVTELCSQTPPQLSPYDASAKRAEAQSALVCSQESPQEQAELISGLNPMSLALAFDKSRLCAGGCVTG